MRVFSINIKETNGFFMAYLSLGNVAPPRLPLVRLRLRLRLHRPILL
jgi:hypothetical protein